MKRYHALPCCGAGLAAALSSLLPVAALADSSADVLKDSGEVKAEFPPDTDVFWFHHRCYPGKATENYLLMSLLTGEPARPPLTDEGARKQGVPERPRFWEHQGTKAVRCGDWQAVAAAGGRWELYNLAADRTEGHNVAGAHPEKISELAALWRDWANRSGVWEMERSARAPPQAGESQATVN